MVWLKKLVRICVVINENQMVNLFFIKLRERKEGGNR